VVKKIQTLESLLEEIRGNFVTFNVLHENKCIISTTIGWVHCEEEENSDLMHFYNHHIYCREPVINQQLWIAKTHLNKYVLYSKSSKMHYIFHCNMAL